MGHAAEAVTIGSEGLGGTLHIWKGGKEVSEKWKRNTHGSCVRNGVLEPTWSAAVYGVGD